MNNTLYTGEQVEDLINQYLKAGGQMLQVEESVLGYGTIILYDNGLSKLLQIVIKEIVLNEWSSAYRVRRYKKLPKTYEVLLKERLFQI